MAKKIVTILSVIFLIADLGTAYGQTGLKRIQGGAASKIIKYSEELLITEGNTLPSVIKFQEGKYSKKDINKVLKSLPLDKRNHFASLQSFKDQKGYEHVRVNQYYDGIEIVGSQYILHFQGDKLVSSNGKLVEAGDVDVQPILSKKQAFEIAQSEWLSTIFSDEENIDSIKTEIELLSNDNKLCLSKSNYDIKNELRLVYQFAINTNQPITRYIIEVDAMNGDVLNKYNRLHTSTVEGSGITEYDGEVIINVYDTGTQFELRDDSRGDGIFTYDMRSGTSFNSSNLVSEADSHFDEADSWSGVSAHFGAAVTYDFYLEKFGRNSYNGQGARINSYVNYGDDYGNAFWDPEQERVVYGGGDGRFNNSFAALDIVGHEITHAITTNTAGLIYLNESGALNESFSDIFGMAIETEAFPETKNWLISEDVFISPDGYLRSMSNPNSRNHPDTYEGEHWEATLADNGGVHTNSGVQNFWFYLLAEGGSGLNDFNHFYEVDGIGLDKALEIAYRNLTVYLTPSSGYEDARLGSELSAKDLFGEESTELNAVKNAWDAVAVPASYPNMVASTNEIDFQEYSFGEFEVRQIEISNNGNTNLPVHKIEVSNSVFTVDNTAFSINPGDSKVINVTYSPTNFIKDDGELIIFSSAGEYLVSLRGEGVAPVKHEISSTAISQGLGPNEKKVLEISLENQNLYDYLLSPKATKPWLEIVEDMIFVQSETTKKLYITLNTQELQPGTYNSEFSLELENPAYFEIVVPIELEVLSLPDIAVEDITIDPIFVFQSTNTTCKIWNKGFEDLLISDFSVSSSDFFVAQTSAVVSPGRSLELNINFDPSSFKPYEETLSISSNDNDFPIKDVSIRAEVINPLSVNNEQNHINIGLWPDSNTSTTISISNLAHLSIQMDLELIQGEDKGYPLNFATILPAQIELPPDGSEEISIEIDSKSTDVGEYFFQIALIPSNLSIPPTIIPLQVSVVKPEISSVSEISFGDAAIGYTDSKILTITNSGTDMLEIFDMAFDNKFFSTTSQNSFNIKPGESVDLQLHFIPIEEAGYNGIISIFSNDPLHPEKEIRLNGVGRFPAYLYVGVDELQVDLKTNTLENVILQIKNTGKGTLSWKADILNWEGEKYEMASLESSKGNLGSGVDMNLSINIDAKKTPYGIYKYWLHLATNDPEKPVSNIPIVVQVFAPSIKLNGSIDIVPTQVNSSTTQEVLVSNEGNDLLLVTDISVDNPAYDVSGTKTFEIQPGYSEIFEVIFTPTHKGEYDGAMSIESNDPIKHDLDVPISGTALNPPIIEVHEKNIEIEALTGSTVKRTITIENLGDSQLNWQTLIEPSALSRQLISAHTTSGSLEPYMKGSIQLEISLKNLPWGNYEQQLTLLSNDPTNEEIIIPINVEVSAPEIENKEILEFGRVIINELVLQELLITNTGTYALNVSAISFDEPVYSLVSEDNFLLNPGESKILEVVFSPLKRIDYAGSMNIESDDPLSSTKVVKMAGEGITHPKLKLAEQMVNYEIESGTIQTKEFVLENIGDNPLVWSINLNSNEDISDLIIVEQKNGIVEGGSSSSVEMTINAKDKKWRDYEFNLDLQTNDTTQTQLEIPFDLRVLGSEISVDSILVFDPVVRGDVLTKSFTIQNIGNASLELTGVHVTNDVFELKNFNTSIASGELTTLDVVFSPETPEEFEGIIEFATNDKLKPNTSIILQGTGLQVLDIPHIADAIEIYPNPFNNELTLENLPSQKIIIFNLIDITGAKVFSKTLFDDGSYKISLPNDLAAGVYQMVLQTKAGIFRVEKLIKN